jgi:hypothetical protein
MSDPHDNSIPVLHEILVPGRARSPSNVAVPATPEADAPREPSFKAEPVLVPEPAHSDEPVLAPQPVLTEEQTHAPEPVLAPSSALHHDEAAVSAGVFDRAEPAAPVEAGSIVPPDIVVHEPAASAQLQQPELDADLIAERLRGRFAGFLTGEGRGIIEARCRDALQEHTTWLVSQITREVALTLETEMSGWVKEAVKEAVEEETARHKARN